MSCTKGRWTEKILLMTTNMTLRVMRIMAQIFVVEEKFLNTGCAGNMSKPLDVYSFKEIFDGYLV